MKLRSLLLLAFCQTSFAFDQHDLEELIDSNDLKALQQIIVSTTASCADKILTNPTDLEFAKKELLEIAEGVGKVISESLLTLALKSDYPTACHVLSQGILADIESSQKTRNNCLLRKPWGGGCLIRQKQQFPVYSYYWPKYFIEVAQKGNDPFPAFAKDNKLYSANRKIANDISGLTDLQGPYKLAAIVTLGTSLVKSATSSLLGQGFDMSATNSEVDQSASTMVLTPFEKLRIRGNQTPDQPSHEVNVWPVGLSDAIAKNLTVCAQGGFQWSIPGLPMTCPVAMSKDAWPYWDSGMIDYLNPHAVRGIAAAANPVSCIGESLSSLALDEYSAKESTEALGDKSSNDFKAGKLSNLPTNLRGLGMCSFPILGTAEAIASQALAVTDSFKGPWCSIWGPVVPRMSTHVQNTDFAFPAAALKFKLLAHDLFGIPRGAKERWALAFPWEDKASEFLTGNLEGLKEQLEHSGIKNINSMFTNTTNKGRSLLLMPPGDPRMLDVFSPTQLATDSKNFAREVIYLSALNASASQAERQALNTLMGDGGHKQVSPSRILTAHHREVKAAIDDTARKKGEPVYRKTVYCHVKGEKHGLFSRDEARMPLPFTDHADDAFERAAGPDQCHRPRRGSCLDRHPVTGKCRRPESVYYVSLERWEVSHYRRIQNPRTYVVDPPECSYNEARTPNVHHRHYTCKERLREIGRDDTRDHIPLPDPNAPEEAIAQGVQPNTATTRAKAELSAAARTATWVGAEIARARYEDISGSSKVPGKKRVYTIFENIKCEPKTLDGRPIYRKEIPGGWVWNSCHDAVKLEVRKYFQTKLLRRVCDNILLQKLGEPFK